MIYDIYQNTVTKSYFAVNREKPIEIPQWCESLGSNYFAETDGCVAAHLVMILPARKPVFLYPNGLDQVFKILQAIGVEYENCGEYQIRVVKG